MLGGTRFIGVYLARMLVDAGHDVTLLTRGKKPVTFRIPDDSVGWWWGSSGKGWVDWVRSGGLHIQDDISETVRCPGHQKQQTQGWRWICMRYRHLERVASSIKHKACTGAVLNFSCTLPHALQTSRTTALPAPSSTLPATAPTPRP